jgi:hypothetical protein
LNDLSPPGSETKKKRLSSSSSAPSGAGSMQSLSDSQQTGGMAASWPAARGSLFASDLNECDSTLDEEDFDKSIPLDERRVAPGETRHISGSWRSSTRSLLLRFTLLALAVICSSLPPP